MNNHDGGELDGGWGEYRKLILAEVQRLSNGIETLNTKFDAMKNDEIGKMKTEIAMLKLKASMFGLAAGAIPGIIGMIYTMFKK